MQENNQVLLTGRVSAAPVARELPSGDRMVSMRIVVPRPRKASDTRNQVDVIDLVAWSKSTQRTATRLKPEDIIEAQGTLRRRFFQSGQARISRYEVELTRVRKLNPGQQA